MTLDEPPGPAGEDHPPADSGGGRPPLGPALRRAWIGYQQRLDAEMVAAGFGDRRFPDGRVLRLCSRSAGLSAAQIGRELGMTRQGAGKIVAQLHELGYVTVGPSPDDAREKIVSLTARGTGYLAAQRHAARRLQDQIRDLLGAESYESLHDLLDVLDVRAQPRLRAYLRSSSRSVVEDPLDGDVEGDEALR